MRFHQLADVDLAARVQHLIVQRKHNLFTTHTAARTVNPPILNSFGHPRTHLSLVEQAGVCVLDFDQPLHQLVRQLA